MNSIIKLVVSAIALFLGIYMLATVDDLITGTSSWETFGKAFIPIVFIISGSLGLLIEGVGKLGGRV